MIYCGAKRMIEKYIKEGIVDAITMPQALDIWAEKYDKRLALVDHNHRITYKELQEKSRYMAGIFRKEGIGKMDNVIIWMNNRIEFFLTLFGLQYIGARPVLLLPSHRDKELDVVSSFCAAKAVITYGTELGYPYTETGVRRMVDREVKVFSFEEKKDAIHLNYDDNDESKRSLDIECVNEPTDIALFLLSGGTTGVPKLIPKKHAAYLYNAKCAAIRCNVTGESVYMAALSIAHDYPLCCPGVIGTLMNGGKCVLSMTAGFDEIADWIKEEHVTFTQIAPAIASVWVECIEWEEDIDFSSLKYVIVGASRLEYELAMDIEDKLGAEIIQGYGLGEGITCFTSPGESKEIAWKCQGKPVSEYDEVQIVDENGNAVGSMQEGELIQKGPYTFDGYYHADKLNQQVFTKEGFFRTGDKAMVTEEGNIVILGRVREQINRAGENIIPSEIEDYIKKVAGIKDAVVIGLPDAVLGEKICAVLIAEERKVEIDELRMALTGMGLAAFKLPDCTYYISSFPLINVGKVDKRLLKENILKQVG